MLGNALSDTPSKPVFYITITIKFQSECTFYKIVRSVNFRRIAVAIIKKSFKTF
jgi:hypothetical protein